MIAMCFKLVWQQIGPSKRPPLSDGLKNPADRIASAIFTIFIIYNNLKYFSSAVPLPAFCFSTSKRPCPHWKNLFSSASWKCLTFGGALMLGCRGVRPSRCFSHRAVWQGAHIPSQLHTEASQWLRLGGRGHNQGCWMRMKLLMRSRDEATFSCSLWRLDWRQTLWGFLGSKTHDPKCKLYL